tara:strand:+ start:2416 stop:2613 length:198 start_codon:yes stop_codon:yes gene_type:complete
MPNFPADPYDGTSVVEEMPNGDLNIWTYDRHTNSWSFELWEQGIRPGEILNKIKELEEALAAKQA